MRRFVLAAVMMLSGCDLYFSDGDDQPCELVGATKEGDIAPEQLFRNPQTGECQGFGGYPCDDRCGPCPETTQAQPDWGSCYSACEGLSESACMAAPGCFAAYTEFPTQDRAAEFRGCWQTAPSGPIDGSCANLDAQQCSRHDNCTAHYDDPATRIATNPPSFLFCAPEPAAGCAATTCAPGTHCEEQCYPCDGTNGPCDPVCQPMCVPDTNACAQIDCGPGWDCVEICTNGHCGAQCVPTTSCEALATEAACAARPDCVTVYKGEDCTCYPGYCECNILTYERCETK